MPLSSHAFNEHVFLSIRPTSSEKYTCDTPAHAVSEKRALPIQFKTIRFSFTWILFRWWKLAQLTHYDDWLCHRLRYGSFDAYIISRSLLFGIPSPPFAPDLLNMDESQSIAVAFVEIPKNWKRSIRSDSYTGSCAGRLARFQALCFVVHVAPNCGSFGMCSHCLNSSE